MREQTVVLVDWTGPKYVWPQLLADLTKKTITGRMFTRNLSFQQEINHICAFKMAEEK